MPYSWSDDVAAACARCGLACVGGYVDTDAPGLAWCSFGCVMRARGSRAVTP